MLSKPSKISLDFFRKNVVRNVKHSKILLRSTIKSLYYYKKLFQLTGNTGKYDSVLSSILNKIHDLVLDSKKLNELKKELKKSIE